MSSALSALRTQWRRRMRDPDSVTFTGNTEVDGYLNGACEWFNRLAPNKLAAGSINTDGLASSFTVAITGIGSLVGFIALKSLRVVDPATGRIILPHPRGMDYIDEQYNAGYIVAETPGYYVFEYPTLAFDRIPDATLNVTVRYWSSLTAMTDAAHTPDGMLGIGNWDRLIVGKACLDAILDIQDESLMRLVDSINAELMGVRGNQGEIGRFVAFVESKATPHSPRGQGVYSELGENPEEPSPMLEGMTYGR